MIIPRSNSTSRRVLLCVPRNSETRILRACGRMHVRGVREMFDRVAGIKEKHFEYIVSDPVKFLFVDTTTLVLLCSYFFLYV